MTKYIGIGAVALFAALSVAGCKVENTDLPEGMYPLTFNGAIEQLVTKSSVEGTWDGSERIAVLSMSGNDAGVVKSYATDANGLMNSSDPFFWSKKNESKDVSAWYCGDGSTDAGGSNSTSIGSWTVQRNQIGDGYQQSDFLYANGVCRYDGNNTLLFYHQLARVVINILNDGVLSDASEIGSVTVGDRNMGLTALFKAPDKGNQTGEWTVEEYDGDIVPNQIGANEGCLASYEAMLIPQNMVGKSFITVALAKGGALTYVPSAGDAELLPGFQYTYNVKVSDLRLDVAVESGASWEEGETIDIDSDIR